MNAPPRKRPKTAERSIPLTPGHVLDEIDGKGWTTIHHLRERMGCWTDHCNLLLTIVGKLERAKLVETRNRWPSCWGFGFEVRKVKGGEA